MRNKELINKIKNLQVLEPSADFRLQSKKTLMAYCESHHLAEAPTFKFSFAPMFLKMGAGVAGIGLVFVLGWYLVLSPMFFPQNSNLNVSNINNEWQLNDISPYLEQILSDDLAINEVDSALNQLAFQETLKQGSGESAIIEEGQLLNLDKQLPALNNHEIDAILEQLSN